MKNSTKHFLVSGAVVLAGVVFAGASIVTFILNPSVYAGLALVPAGYGVYAFVKKYHPKDDE